MDQIKVFRVVKTVFLVFALCSLRVIWAYAQTTEVRWQLPVGEFEPQQLGVTEFVPQEGVFTKDQKEIATQMAQVIRQDLEYSLVFQVIGIDPFVTSVLSEDWLNFEAWFHLGAKLLLFGKLKFKDDKIIAEAHLYDVYREKKIFAKSYKASSSDFRTLAHTISDDIYGYFTGEKGIFTTKIAYVSTQKEGIKEIYICDYDGHNPQKVTNDQSIDLSPTWSPDGEKIVYTSYRDGNPDLWIRDLGETNTKKISSQVGLNSAACWSPNGKHIALTLTKDGNAEIYLITPQGKIAQRLTHSWGIDSSPSWSPTGKQIVFTSDRAGKPQIYIMDSEGSNVRRLTFQEDYMDSPAWSPKGDRIAFVLRSPEGKFNICTIDITGENFRVLTDTGSNENPGWSPDGYHLVFSSDRSGEYEIYTMNWDGSNQRRITQGGGNFNPSWSLRF